jgi:hypothetical protein
MRHDTKGASERRWIVLGEDGRHVTLGRHADPSPEEIAAAEAALVGQCLAGWLAVAEGDPWRRGARVRLLEVRPLAEPSVPFQGAVEAFQARRAATLAPARQAA